MLNAFDIPYRVLHDEDPGSDTEQAENGRIRALLPDRGAPLHLVTPDLEGLLGYEPPKKNKPFTAVLNVERLHNQGQLPDAFQEAVRIAYFGGPIEPQ